MNCEILNTLYVKSNGEILCNDDYGERVSLGSVTDNLQVRDLETLFTNEAYQHIRKAYAGGEVPWKGICEQCAFIRHDEPFTDYLADKHLTKLQLEPSLRCNLDCLGCTNDIQIRTREMPHLMDPATFDALLAALNNGGYRLDSIEYCGQGEPLMHPQFAEFARIGRRYYPRAWQRVITNGNFSYEKTLGDAPVDEIMVAGDGLFQESYSSYRVKGKVDKVLSFMRDAAASRQQGRPLVIWKYILFEFNDSDRELKAAQEKAIEIGVDTLVFVLTHSAHRSIKYTTKSIARLPIIAANVTTNAHPSFFDGVLYGEQQKSLVNSLADKLKRGCMAKIDEVMIMPGDILQLRGWATAKSGVSRIVVRDDTGAIGETIATDLRPDVEEVHPQFNRQPMGFRLSTPLAGQAERNIRFQLELYDKNDCLIGRFRSLWRFRA